MTTLDVIRTLVGEIYPVGETEHDDMAYENLSNYGSLVLAMIDDIIDIAEDKDRSQSSISKAGRRAAYLITEIRNKLEEDAK